MAYFTIAMIINTLLARKLPMLEGIFVIFHIFGIAIFIPLWILSPRRIGGSPLIDFYNPNGWVSNGVATLVGLSGPTAGLIGLDCSVHMGMFVCPLENFSYSSYTYCLAEEVKDSSLTVPVTLLVAFTTNFFLGLFALMSW
jgi:hypothetical protein